MGRKPMILLLFISALSCLALADSFVLQHATMRPRRGSDAAVMRLALSSTQASTTTDLSSNENPSVWGDSVTFTATIVATGSPTPTGTVNFTVDGSPLCTGEAVSSKMATCSSALLVTGTHAIVATYSGDSNYLPSTSAPLSQVVNPATLTVTANNQTMVAGGASPTFTVSYSGFKNGDTPSVLTGAPSISVVCGGNNCTFSAGTYTIMVQQGTLAATNYTFTFVNGTLTVIPAASLQVAASQSALSIMAGATGSVTVTVTENGGLTSADVSCSAGGLTCAMSPSTVTFNSGSATATATITTSTANAALRPMRGRSKWLVALAVVLPGVLLLPVASSRRLSRRLFVVIGIVVLTALAFAGCGGRSTQSIPYLVTVTATAQNASASDTFAVDVFN